MNNKCAFKTAVSLAVFSVLTFAAVASIWYFFFAGDKTDIKRVSAEPSPVVVIDPGHGGMDGGCVSGSVPPITEKELNLEISNILTALFRLSGYDVIMTRDTDVMPDSEGLTGSAKMRDLKTRLMIAREHPDALFISVHCNKFPDSSCSGLQVYYSKNHPESKLSAEAVQSSVVSLLQPNNRRATKAADSSIYLLDRATHPAILIECGFLSNPEDTANLADTVYQKKLALTILLPLIEQ